MGTIFRLIADDALQPEDPSYYTECQVCERPRVPVYPCQGYLARPDGTADKSQDVYVACEECLKHEHIVHLSEYRTDPLIERFANDPKAEKSLLRKTPRIPFQMHGDDWPLCCGTLTEFAGSPSSLDQLISIQAKASPWELGPVAPPYYDARKDGPPESFREVSVFRCFVCGRRYWTFQYS
jgi:hypothetical protein